MKFRTEIEIAPRPGLMHHDGGIVMLGSCFTDNVGARLEQDGFRVTHNPMGPLYNPASILQAMRRAVGDLPPYSPSEMVMGSDGAYHCLDFASRYTDADANALAMRVNAEVGALGEAIRQARTIIITLGTAYVFSRDGQTVGNCHKFPPQEFQRRRLSPREVTECIEQIYALAPHAQFIFTVSPIRHTADGLHGNQLSKATLLLGLDQAQADFEYFPAYEILMDDLRDYRFYAADMKHPSDTAVDYIYQLFCQAYLSSADQQRAAECRRAWKAANHRPIL